MEPNLDKLPDPFEGAPEVEPAAEVAETPAETPVQEPDYKAEAERLKAENAALKNISVTVNTPQAPAPAKTEMTEAEMRAYAKANGLVDENGEGDIVKLKAMHNLGAAIAAPAYAELNALKQEREIEKSIARAKREAAANDPQFSKYEAHVDEFLDTLPASEKTPERLKVHMATAKLVARGKIGVAAPAPRRQAPSPIKDNKLDNVNSEPESYVTPNGAFTLKVSKRVAPEVMKRHTLADGTLQIDLKEELEAGKPKFR